MPSRHTLNKSNVTWGVVYSLFFRGLYVCVLSSLYTKLKNPGFFQPFLCVILCTGTRRRTMWIETAEQRRWQTWRIRPLTLRHTDLICCQTITHLQDTPATPTTERSVFKRFCFLS